MAQVWRAVHADGTPVAVKILSHEGARDEGYLSAFRHEVRTVASLDHPNVVLVFDHGRVPADFAAQDADLLAGSPYLVTEWASGATLAKPEGLPSDWAQMNALLDALLDALSHAHARGVLHRDIKPSNILRCTEADLRPGLKLADFGIARHLAAPEEEEPAPSWGTPSYMAPEQIMGIRPEEGPWTDLYSVGCLAHRLACGTPPFLGTIDEVYEQHLVGDFPALTPRFEVPESFEAWVATLTRRDWKERLLHAADARRALADLDAEPARTGRLAEIDTRVSSNAVPTMAEDARDERARAAAKAHARAPSVRPRPRLELRTPVVPTSWRLARDAEAAPALPRDVGLGLFALRPRPLVGREAERDHLWQALAGVATERRARTVLVRGAPGAGKSGLARWLCVRAAERGAAHPLLAAHRRGSGLQDAIGAMLRRGLACMHLSRAHAFQRTAALVDAWGLGNPARARRIASAFASLGHDEEDAVSAHVFRSVAERHEEISSFLADWAERRPLVIWLDDVQWGADSLVWALHHLDSRPTSRTLLVATVGTDALRRRSEEDDLIEELATRPETTELTLGPLPPEAMSILVRRTLGVEPELAMKLERRAAGNPMYAVELIADWVQRGLLESGIEGFALKPGAQPSLPASVLEVWRGPVEQALADGTGAEREILTAAAALGNQVSRAEWTEVCASLGHDAPEAALDAWIERGLVRDEAELPRFRFVHEIVRELLLEAAEAAGTSERLHAACARMLEKRRGSDRDVRLAEHRLRSGDQRAAIAPLVRSATRLNDALDFRLAASLLREAEGAFERIGLPEDDPSWGDVWIARAWNMRVRGMREEAARLAERTEEAAERHGWRVHRARARWMRAVARVDHGDLEEARRLAEESLELMVDQSPVGHRLSSLRLLGYVYRHQGAPERAVEVLTEALEVASESDDVGELGHCLRDLGDAFHTAGQHERALSTYREALPKLEEAGLSQHRALALERIAASSLPLGRYQEAEKEVLQALAGLEHEGAFESSMFWWHTRLTYAHVLIAQGRCAEARSVLRRCSAWFRRAEITLPLSYERTLRLAMLAQEDQEDELEAVLARLEEDVGSGAPMPPECAVAMELVRRLAEAHDVAAAPRVKALRDRIDARVGYRREAAPAQ